MKARIAWGAANAAASTGNRSVGKGLWPEDTIICRSLIKAKGTYCTAPWRLCARDFLALRDMDETDPELGDEASSSHL